MRAKKSLGQNFLKSISVVNKIVGIADIKESDTILEIGPGKGFLTAKILEKAKNVIVVEKDNDLIGLLEEKFADFIKNGNLTIINADILDFDIKNIKKPYKLVANIPYYITGQIIKNFLSSKNQPEKMVLMVQKEVAKRIVDDTESILSLSVKVYGQPKYIQTVKAKYFSPAPKVDSAVLLIDNISKNFFENIDENLFFEMIKAGFSHKRKVLISNLKQICKNTKKLEEVFKNNDISLKARAENLSKDDWKKLYIAIYE